MANDGFAVPAACITANSQKSHTDDLRLGGVLVRSGAKLSHHVPHDFSEWVDVHGVDGWPQALGCPFPACAGHPGRYVLDCQSHRCNVRREANEVARHVRIGKKSTSIEPGFPVPKMPPMASSIFWIRASFTDDTEWPYLISSITAAAKLPKGHQPKQSQASRAEQVPCYSPLDMGPIRRRRAEKLQQEPRPLALLDGNIAV